MIEPLDEIIRLKRELGAALGEVKMLRQRTEELHGLVAAADDLSRTVTDQRVWMVEASNYITMLEAALFGVHDNANKLGHSLAEQRRKVFR